MELQRAKELLKILSDGINPLTGEVLPAEDSANQAEIVRAIYTVLNEIENRNPPKGKNLPENNGKPWTEEDDNRLCQLFDDGIPQKEICKIFGRTRGSIASRLVRLGKIESRDEFKETMR